MLTEVEAYAGLGRPRRARLPRTPSPHAAPVRAAGDAVLLPVVRHPHLREPGLWCRRRWIGGASACGSGGGRVRSRPLPASGGGGCCAGPWARQSGSGDGLDPRRFRSKARRPPGTGRPRRPGRDRLRSAGGGDGGSRPAVEILGGRRSDGLGLPSESSDPSGQPGLVREAFRSPGARSAASALMVRARRSGNPRAGRQGERGGVQGRRRRPGRQPIRPRPRARSPIDRCDARCERPGGPRPARSSPASRPRTSAG